MLRGDFQIERINELTGDWDLITTIPDGIFADSTPTIQDLVHKCVDLSRSSNRFERTRHP